MLGNTCGILWKGDNNEAACDSCHYCQYLLFLWENQSSQGKKWPTSFPCSSSAYSNLSECIKLQCLVTWSNSNGLRDLQGSNPKSHELSLILVVHTTCKLIVFAVPAICTIGYRVGRSLSQLLAKYSESLHWKPVENKHCWPLAIHT